ncbi:MAG: hypothetical protein SF052_22110 [Bacteroidia bacterium]|nr:hypothetical protein [Bacteroidia bacterium]
MNPFPEAEISNGLIQARLYLPDANTGYYRGSRFDWAGVIPELSYKGHTYFSQWFGKYSPTLHDAIMGPVEAFSPVGYEEAAPGENFLLVGIGMAEKPVEPKYFFTTPYKIINNGNWKVKKKPDQITFSQTLSDEVYAYKYVKTVQLTKGKPEMVLAHSLKNTGSKTIETSVYNHNFFQMDNQPIGPDYVVSFPFQLTVDPGEKTVLGEIKGNQILFAKELTGNEHLFYRTLQGYSDRAEDYDIKIENHKTGAAVRITCDQPLSKFVFWSAPKTICPEPYIHLKIEPGETVTWKILYEFYVLDRQ